jgi:3-deoxy-7-phosphoheptulonate synthase
VFGEVLGNFAAGQQALLGVMIESNLRPGRQNWMQGASLAYGVSITDGCIGWDETARLLLDGAERLAGASSSRPRRAAVS